MTDSPTIGVTGAAGYIGSRVVKLIREKRPEWGVVALDNFEHGDCQQMADVPVREVDIRDRAAIGNALAGTDAIIHLAAVSGVDACESNPGLAHDVNVTGTANVAYHCQQTGAALAFSFSMAVLGEATSFPITADHARAPMNWYGRTKHIGEQALDAFADGEFPVCCLMKSNVYGDHHANGQRVTKNTVINFFIDRALSGQPLTVYEPGT